MTTKKKPAVKKKRNPQDATLRNIRALKKRVKDLEEFQCSLVSSKDFLPWIQGRWESDKKGDKNG